MNYSLAGRNTPETVTGWIFKMLSKRIIQISVQDVKIKGLVTRGCPQGGGLSPLLWNTVLDSLIVLFENHNHYRIAYADDVVILQTGKFEISLCERMQAALRIIEKWCTKYTLSISPKKTEMVFFTRKHPHYSILS